MKISINMKRFTFYLWLGAVYMLLWTFLITGKEDGSLLARASNEIWRAIYIVVVNFILFEYTLPYIKLTFKRILIGIVLIWTHLMFYSFGLFAWVLIGSGLNIYTGSDNPLPSEKDAEYQVAYSFGSILLFGIIRHVYDHIKLKQSARQLRVEKQEAELNYLKSQTNPHFLFNTLNNIYSLARDKSDLAPESILRLSKILRFMLYETSGQFIAIEQELKIINDYIALEKLRYDESLSINFNYDIEDMKQAIPPLMLVPLVENAFKHGVSETRHQPFVDIHLSVRQRQLTFIVKNSSERTNEGLPKESIGLSNLRRQLELQYKEYNLSVQQDPSVFTAIMKINLGSHV